MKKKLVGITIKVDSTDYSLWSAGNRLNIFFLADALMRSGNYEVCVVNLEPRKLTPKENPASWDKAKYRYVHYDEVKDALDMLIILGAEISTAIAQDLKRRGCKLVYYVAGNRYIMDMEDVLFKGGRHPKQDHSYFDEFWLIPQMVSTCEHYLSTLYGGRMRHVPFVWSPEFLDRSRGTLPNKGLYAPRKGPRRIASFEPNLNVVKYVMYDLLIAEQAFRRRPELIRLFMMTNTFQLVHNAAFMSLAMRLSMVKQKKASFEKRYLMPFFLANYTDVVLAHQWENALNYAYLDALYLGFPLVHNAHFVKDAGYYYEGFDVMQGADQLVHALAAYDDEFGMQQDRNAAVLGRYRSDSPAVVAAYDAAVAACLEGRA